MRLLIATLALSLVAASPSDARPDGRTLKVLPVSGSPDLIEVFPAGARSGFQAFCAAGQFAKRQGAGATDRLEVVKPVSRSDQLPNLRSVVFRLSGPDRDRARGLQTLNIYRSGANLTVAHAASFCSRSRGNS